MKLLIFGDVHGCWHDLNIAIARGLRKHPDTTAMIQVGDLGYAWPGDRKGFKLSRAFFPSQFNDKLMQSSEEYDRAIATPLHWIDGNHENHDQLDADQGARQPNMTYQPRGSIRRFEYDREPESSSCPHGYVHFKTAMFFGGASSWDKDQRIIGKSWWPQECITYAQTLKALQYEGPLDIVFSHEHPLAFPYSERRYDSIFGIGDKQALDALRLKFKPLFWVFGHHHYFDTGETDGTIWACAPVIGEKEHGNPSERQQQYIVFDGERLYLDD